MAKNDPVEETKDKVPPSSSLPVIPPPSFLSYVLPEYKGFSSLQELPTNILSSLLSTPHPQDSLRTGMEGWVGTGPDCLSEKDQRNTRSLASFPYPERAVSALQD